MPSMKLLALSTILSGALASTINLNGNQCPNGWGTNSIGNDPKIYCCFGSSIINNDDGFCCVNSPGSSSSGSVGGGGIVGGNPGDECFPFCSTTANDKRDIPEPSCAAKIPFTASDYSQRVSSASKSVLSQASATGSGSGPSTNTDAAATEDSTSGGSGTAASKTGDSSKPTSTNAGAAVTGAALNVGGAVAAALLMM